MVKNLLIVESPSKAKTIEKYLGNEFMVKASYGHVRDLPKGNDAINIEQGFEPTYVVTDDKKEVIAELKKLAKKAETVWLATDEDREGEAISWHLAEVLGLDIATTKRIVFNEITKKAIQDAILKPRTLDMNLVYAQQARRVLDRLVGFQISPVLWSKIKAGLSAGRVQSVAVRLVVEREREVFEFNAVPQFRVIAEFRLASGAKVKAELPVRFNTEAEAMAFMQKLPGAAYQVAGMETKPAKRSPAAPFTTSTLQQEAARKLGFSVALTMRVAQSLYESGKITYMRTDSVNLSEEAQGFIRNEVQHRFGDRYHHRRNYRNKIANAQEAHEAIRPTDMRVDAIVGERNEQRLYELIWKRTIASQMADAELERTIVQINISTTPEKFVAEGEVIRFDGFLKLYLESTDEEKDDDEKSGMLPPMKVGDALFADSILAEERYARPPARYTEASLVKRMEELGIGRPSTYAPTISTIQKRGYVVKEDREGVQRRLRQIFVEHDTLRTASRTEITGAEKSKLFPTDLGMLVTDFLIERFPRILDFSFTARVEEEFDEISNGEIRWNDMLHEFYAAFSQDVQNTKDQAGRVNKDRLLGEHPESRKPVIAKFGRFGPFVQIGSSEDEEKPRYASLRSNQRLETITLEEALDLFNLPRIIGEIEGHPAKVNIGRFGPYVQVGKEFFSIPKGVDPFTVDVPMAEEIIRAKREKDASKLLRKLSDDCEVIQGRWGPFIKFRGENLKMPKGVTPETLTLEQCEALLAAMPAKTGTKKKTGESGTKKAAATTKSVKAATTAKKPASKSKKAAPKKKTPKK